MSICLRHVDPHSLEIYEDCVGLYATEQTNADTITELILDMLFRYNFPLKNCTTQCYDGAANMAGQDAGMTTKIRVGA